MAQMTLFFFLTAILLRRRTQRVRQSLVTTTPRMRIIAILAGIVAVTAEVMEAISFLRGSSTSRPHPEGGFFL